MTNKKGVTNGRGSVLLAVIWILAMLTIFTVVVSRNASGELLMGAWMKDRITTRFLAQSGVERALHEIQQDKFLTFEAMNETWASSPKAFKEIPLGEGTFSVVCDPEGRDIEMERLKSDEVLYGACDESARININTADEKVLTNLFVAVKTGMNEKEARAIALAVLDWRDTDNDERDGGAEANQYKSLKVPYEPRNGPFESVEELAMVKGISAELFRLVAPYITVYTEGPVNFNTASTMALRALGLSEALANKVADFRKGADKQSGTKDDEVFSVVEGITPALSAASSFSVEEFAQISNGIGQSLVSVKSEVFRIQAIGRSIRSSRSFETWVTGVVKRDGTVLYWHEGKV